MSTNVEARETRSEAQILEFARAFRGAARAVGFYPPSHPAVVSSLESVALATKTITAAGPLCLTVLPSRLLVGGEPVEGGEAVFADVSRILHRHGIGALNLNARATLDSWLALFGLLARRPDEVRAAGGFQREWLALRHTSPAVLEIDFGELLRGRIGGDVAELAGIIGHYLESGGIGISPGDDVAVALRRVLDNAPGAKEAVAGILRELKTAAFLTRAVHPDHLDDMFRQAATVGDAFGEEIMAGLLACQGTPDAMAGPLNVVTAFVGQMPDATIVQFLASAIVESGSTSARLAGVYASLVSEPGRRRQVLVSVQQALASRPDFAPDAAGKWDELENQLKRQSDRQFVPDRYAHELATARSRSTGQERRNTNPEARVAGWVDSLADESVHELDLQLLADLARLESSPRHWPEVLDILRRHVHDAAEADNWEDAARVAEAIEREARVPGDTARRTLASETLQKLASSRVGDDALAKLGEAEPAASRVMIRLMCAMGPSLVPDVARRWMNESRVPARDRLADVVAGLGRDGREALRGLLDSKDPVLRRAGIRLLQRVRCTEHLPALEAMLCDPDPGVRRDALEAIAAVPSDRGAEMLARGIAHADGPHQKTLLGQVSALGSARAAPILRRVLTRLDQRTVARDVYLSIIETLRAVANDDAVAALRVVFADSLRRAPIRGRQFRAAARKALRGIGGPAAAAVLRDVSLLGRLRPGRWISRQPTPIEAPSRTGVDA